MNNKEEITVNAVVEQSSMSPMELLTRAIDKGTDLAQLEKAMELQFRWDAEQARKAYLTALAEFQKEVPSIEKSQPVAYPNKVTKQYDVDENGNIIVAFWFAPYEKIVEVIKPILEKHGLSYRHRMSPCEQGQQEVACIISHEQGHESIEAVMQHGMDQSGGKNDIQAKGSTLKYLKRLTLEAALGLTTGPADLDGSADAPQKTGPGSGNPESVAVTAAREMNLKGKALESAQLYASKLKAALKRDDALGFMELYAEMSGDEQTFAAGMMNRAERKQAKQIVKDAKEAAANE